jgi:hypothetical protein
MEVAAITGHKDLRMLQRYTHLKAEDLARKLGQQFCEIEHRGYASTQRLILSCFQHGEIEVEDKSNFHFL